MEARRHLAWLAIVAFGIMIVVRASNLDSNSEQETGIDADFVVDQLLDQLPERTYDPADPNELPWRIFWLRTEVNNGGMDQYFYNSSGEFAKEAVADLRLIGAPKTAALVEQGCQVFPAGKPARDTELRRVQMERFTREQEFLLQSLSDPFYACGEDLNALLVKYWEKKH